MSLRFKAVLMRVLRTFMQTFIPVFLVTVLGPLQNVWADVVHWAAGTGVLYQPDHVNALRAALVAAISAGIVACVSMIWNLLNTYFKVGNNWGLLGTPNDTKIGQKVLDPKDPSMAVVDGKQVG